MSEVPCPELAAFAVAEEMLERHRGAHADYVAASKRLAMVREISERLHAELPCAPTINLYGSLVCSLAAVH